MHWNITDMLVSPATGTAFALARNTSELSVIIWYKGSYFLRPNNKLKTDAQGVIVDGKSRNFNIVHTMPFFPSVWRTIKNSCNCPGNDNVSLRNCDQQQDCLFELCPYGIKMIS
ncbi:hypothetical protein GA0061071_105148 [Kosakonia oryzendophytica]|uniref:Anti-adapter protein IraM n=1 Tax=Kosakonia oryzendophytica TaxID=1005665 RepID=A0A1C4BLW1_9ENTR|nr:hypothetical protein [Kosakonia oryzendophytica]AMO49632.1 Anti-adapter protein iraM [Enterobacter sp. FY-07]TDT59491.1 hypothetical protein DFO53_1073 [Enterobacter sp. AG5470]WBT60433.1 anti-adapter protein iraM [Kosakonia oryzendophytica]SCC07662.1 hypothetical protein GA0061071_105148 [Kosakonia oryzendophytica]